MAHDMDLDGIQAGILHPQLELPVNFLDAVLLETTIHAGASVHRVHIAMLITVYIGKCKNSGKLHGQSWTGA